jgi:hypothetical protein
MKTKEDIELVKITIACKAKAISSIKTCFHPNCCKQSINSHILQKNGILSQIAPNKHLWQIETDNFSDSLFVFKRRGLNEIYSFNCFCRDHDRDLFSKIETDKIDFNDYESCLLFNLRILYNELFRKRVNVLHFRFLLERLPKIYDTPGFMEQIRQQELGIEDLYFTEKQIWNDLENKTESFVFENRELSKLELCLSSFFNYETTNEVNLYKKLNNGKDIERLSEIFINLFPYGNNSILLMGYHKIDERNVRGYFYNYFKENEKRVQRRLTNLMLFQCENWVCSESVYDKIIKGKDNLFSDASFFSHNNINERRNFDINIWDKKFGIQFQNWKNGCNKLKHI